MDIPSGLGSPRGPGPEVSLQKLCVREGERLQLQWGLVGHLTFPCARWAMVLLSLAVTAGSRLNEPV